MSTKLTPEVFAAYGQARLLVAQALAHVRTCYLAKVVSASQAGDVAGIGTVDVQPCVSQLDSLGNVIPHDTIRGIKYMRMQGGANAMILDPAEGDIGLVAVCDRDSSSVIANNDVAAPGSLRKHDMSDSFYVATVVAASAPSQYVCYADDGIDIVSPKRIRFIAPEVVIDASRAFNVTSPQSTFSAAVTIRGLLTWLGGMAGSAAEGLAATITGAVDFIGEVFANGKRIDDTHRHTSEPPGTPTSPPL
ncbi:oxidoreductase [Paraburkholderia sp. MM6662-R1]|uniref:oxidoreductase n=1 Tax=Paraburkholderia sp. MM6662-R1 TaxID=2991066 RepID=UPI003D2063BF